MAEFKGTPGPWLWVKRQYPSSKVVELIHPHRGYLLVMDFVRLGMQGGTFRLATWNGDERGNMGGVMRPAHEIDWANHPDARLIAASPDLLAACQAFAKWFDGWCPNQGCCARSGLPVHEQALAAIRKATEGN